MRVNTAAVISEMQTDRCRPLLQTKPRATSTLLPGLACLYASLRRSSMHVHMSLINPFIWALWHMPRMFTTLVPRCREADPSVSRRHRVSTTCVCSQVVNSRRVCLRSDMPGSFHQSDWRTSNERQLFGTSFKQSRRFLQPIENVQNFSSARPSSRLAALERDCAIPWSGCPGQLDQVD